MSFFKGTSTDQVSLLMRPRALAFESASPSVHEHRSSPARALAHSLSQDPRFKDKQAMLRKKMSFPPSFETKVRFLSLSFSSTRPPFELFLFSRGGDGGQVDMRKVEMAVMKPWIAKKVIDLLGFEDDVLIEYINSLLEDADNPVRTISL